MIDRDQALQQLLQRTGLPSTLFPPTSRYHGTKTATLETKDGREVIYLRRRFVPSPRRFELLQEHVVEQGERLDNITARYMDNPELFWRICDANRAMRPEEQEQTGRRLRITMPEGIPGMQNA